MPELNIDVTGWDVAAHTRAVVLHLHHGDQSQPVQVTPDQAVLMGIRLIQAAYVSDSAVCTQPGAMSALSRIDEVLDEHANAPSVLGVRRG